MSHKVFQDPPIDVQFADKNGIINYPWERWLFDITAVQTDIRVVEIPINPASVAANTTVEQTITITQVIDHDGNTITIGANVVVVDVGDIILQVIKPTNTAGIAIGQARVDTKNKIELQLINTTAGALDPASENYKFVVLKG